MDETALTLGYRLGWLRQYSFSHDRWSRMLALPHGEGGALAGSVSLVMGVNPGL